LNSALLTVSHSNAMIRFGVFGVHDAHITPQTIIPGSSYHFNDSHV
jgi:hypothetical protein